MRWMEVRTRRDFVLRHVAAAAAEAAAGSSSDVYLSLYQSLYVELPPPLLCLFGGMGERVCRRVITDVYRLRMQISGFGLLRPLSQRKKTKEIAK